MPKAGTLGDVIFEAVKSEMPMAGVNENIARAGVKLLVDALTAKGWEIIPPGGVVGAPSDAPRREAVKVEPTSYFCPHCGKHKPPVGISSQNAELPGLGVVGIITIFCGNENCRMIHERIITPPMEARPREGQTGHA